ncbi:MULTISPECIES: heme acquisition protein HasA [Roseobacteraceae]|uniref:Heme-binding protein A (HasA) n=2 Tax=Rhodobacterales TaxID=204455 RepID=A0A221K867_9RHOB|nr:heme-binding protein A (HasA) [Pseudosulfitobacter pseudonitzschiae]
MTTINYNGATDFVAALEDFADFFDSQYWGFFSGNPTDFVGREFAIADSAATTPVFVGSADTVVIGSGAPDGLQYTFNTHTLDGSVDSVRFGSGLSYDSGSDTFSQTSNDFEISDLGLNGSGSGNVVHNVVYGMMQSDPTALLQEMVDDNITVNGSTGSDVLYGFEGDDTLAGDSGVDTFVFDLDALDGFGITLSSIGNDTITDFDVANEVIEISLNDEDYDTFAELDISYSDGDAVIDLGDYGTITLDGVAEDSLTSDNFLFTDDALAA